MKHLGPTFLPGPVLNDTFLACAGMSDNIFRKALKA